MSRPGKILRPRPVRTIPGEDTRFFVPSDQSNDEADDYLVDLLAYHGNGCCACQDFCFRCEPLVKNRLGPGLPVRCKHLKRAREFALDLYIQWKIQQEKRTKVNAVRGRSKRYG